jgi:hypothetical protein
MLLLCSGLVPFSADGATLERGVAVTDPLALRELDLREHRTDGAAAPGFGLNRILDAAAAGDAPMANDKLFALPSMAPIRKALDADYERYVAERRADAPRQSIGVGPTYAVQLFDRTQLYSGQTRFMLAGIVNRMDRAYVAPESCGEIRLLYRLTHIGGAAGASSSSSLSSSSPLLSSPSPPAGEGRGGGATSEASVRGTPTPDPSPQGGGEPASTAAAPSTASAAPSTVATPATVTAHSRTADEAAVSPAADASIASLRLPMTLNIVLKARGDGMAASCADIARRWLAITELPQDGADLAVKLMAEGGPLELIRPENIDRIETNLQIAHAPKSDVSDFRTDYLMKVFHYDPQARIYTEATLENQLDRDRILKEPALGLEFKTWLLDPKHLSEFDRGTVLVPEKFLATRAVAPTPIGFARSSLQPAFGLVGGDEAGAPLFKESDIVTALQQAAERGVAFENIHSPAGFERRLNDMSCAGCHQTRGIGGFHFPGVDWMAAKPSNSTVVPASPHFFGDQIRRRDIVTALRDGTAVDFSRGFSDRPQLRGSTELDGTEYDDGWGSHCYQQRAADAAENDASFKGWSCAAGLACEVTGEAEKSSHMGMCFVPMPSR